MRYFANVHSVGYGKMIKSNFMLVLLKLPRTEHLRGSRSGWPWPCQSCQNNELRPRRALLLCFCTWAFWWAIPLGRPLTLLPFPKQAAPGNWWALLCVWPVEEINYITRARRYVKNGRMVACVWEPWTPVSMSHRCNLKFSSSHVDKSKKRTDEINFNLFYWTHYTPRGTIST